jgi:hypothetical protein
MSKDNKRFIVCINCEIPHVENCGSCFGWGFYADGRLVNANAAHKLKEINLDKAMKNFKPCPECGSNVNGAM